MKTTPNSFNARLSKARRGLRLDLFGIAWSCSMFLFLSGMAHGFEPQCKPDEWFKCNDGLCVTKHWRCDGEPDCMDGSDEFGCDTDLEPDARAINVTDSGSDDTEAEHKNEFLFKPCDNATEFQCTTSSLCVPKYWLCDGTSDCTDSSDEEPEMCQIYKSELHCEEDMFFCGDADKQCIPERWTCDGNADCPNSFDEHPRTCPNSTVEKSNNCLHEFPCKKQAEEGLEDEAEQICLPWELVCNNDGDCPLGDDEGMECAESCKDIECKGENERCRGNPNKGGEGTCVCDSGFKLDTNGTCVDIDECEELQVPPCSQKCLNGIGDFFCECAFGYKLDKSGNCKAESFHGKAILYFSGVTEIRSREISDNNHYALITDDHSKVRQAIGVAYDSNDARIYWSDVSHKFIASSNLDGADFRTWNHSNIEKPEFLAIDYLGRNFYYSDSKKRLIGVCTIRGKYCQGVITSGVTNPRGIAVQPDQGLLAYSNWDDNLDNHPHIGLAGMDGENLVILVNESIRWPNGLAFDMPSNRLFWGEAYFDLLESIRLDGTGRISVKPATNFMSLHPFSVAVFEDTIYWSDYGLRDIQSCHKFTGENHEVVVKSARIQTYGIQIAHELLEPPLYSPCNHERCAHMCLIKKGGQEGVCKCATLFKLVNGHDCIPDVHIPSFSNISLPAIGSRDLKTNLTMTSSTTVESSTSETTTTTTESNAIILDDENIGGNNNTSHQSAVKIEENSTGVVVGVIVAVLLFLCCVFGIYCVWKRKIATKHSSFSKLPNINGVKELFSTTADDQGELLISYQSAMEAENHHYEGDRSENFSTCEA
jgi:hypothetical protein